MPLTTTQIQKAKPEAKARKIFDEKGLFVLIHPNGGKWWRFKYRFEGKEKLLALGTFPEISLAEARERRDESRSLVARGIDPSKLKQSRKAAKLEAAGNSFAGVAEEWLSKKAALWSPGHSLRVRRSLEADVYPALGQQPVSELRAKDFLSVVRKIESRGAIETAHRALSNCSQIMRFAVQTARAESDPCINLKGALQPAKTKHLAAITEPARIGPLLKKLNSYKGTYSVCCALKLSPLVFVRPGELRSAKWDDIDLDLAEWRFKVSKTDSDHIVPLSRQAVTVLRDLKSLNHQSKFVFPNARTSQKCMSENAVLAALRSLDIPKEEMCGHGFRAMARTVLEEVLGYRPDIVEMQLAHSVRDPLGRAYNRTTHLETRREMMQSWADWLEKRHAEADDDGN
jgi:integrase